MKRSWFSILLVAGLLALLGVLAALQSVWLGQISEAEKERMTRRLETDTGRFGEDFNREIQGAYFNFQADETLWQKKDWARFNERYDFWLGKTAYKNLITDFYYFENKPESVVSRYDAEKRAFTEAKWTDELQSIKANIGDQKSFQPIDEAHFALVMPVYEGERAFEIFVRKAAKPVKEDNIPPASAKIDLPERKGFLVIKLDENVIKNQILPDLAKKHFPENDFNLAVVGKNGQQIFQTNEVNSPERTTKLFDLSPDNLMFFANRDSLPRSPKTEGKGVIINQSLESHTVSTIRTGNLSADKLPQKETVGTFQFQLRDGEKQRAMIQTNLSQEGNWTLNVQHRAGSLDKFIANTRSKNLGISFGILGLLAVSIVLVFVSAQRAKIFAQRQIDFVSSVSHEFRTPLAVIYSAGENLADGVTRDERQVSRYGDLIKSEGKKLSAMVEQILDFAGASSGRKKYDLREQNVQTIIETALQECRSLIEEKGFAVETEIAENLPAVKADANALSQAIQNLIGNSLKYSNGEKWLKISAKNGDGRVKIVVEDRGLGIAPQDLKHIFEPFYRAKAVVDEQIHGNGLGLSLVKETVEAHGGKISAASEIGKGSKFTIELPQKEISRG
jgi:signal transduction histidine kinase